MAKALKVAKLIFVTLLMALSIGIMVFTIVSVNVFNRTDRNIFGFRMFIVLSDSMSATDFDAGDLILTREADFDSLQAGDIVTFISQNPGSYGQVVTHKIRERTTDQAGEAALVTYGTTTDTNDKTLVTEQFVLGKYAGRIPKVGAFFNFLKTPVGYLVCILLPFLVLILYQGYNCVRLFRKYRQEQWGDVKAERERLEAERAENERMIEELRALKEQLNATIEQNTATKQSAAGADKGSEQSPDQTE